MRAARSLGLTPLVCGALACAPMQEHDKNPPSAGAISGVRALARGVTVETERARSKAVMDSLYSAAVTGCDSLACAAVARGELLLGMSEAQLYAATKSAPAVWSIRTEPGAAVMVPAAVSAAAHDIKGDVMLAQFDGERLSEIWYAVSDSAVRVVARSAVTADAAAEFALARRLDGEGKSVEALLRYRRVVQLGGRDAAAARERARGLAGGEAR